MGLLRTEVIGGHLVISIGLDALKASLESGSLDMRVGGEFHVTNMGEFIQEFQKYLMAEMEDGSTPIHLMFDNVVSEMLEDTDTGCEIVEV